MVSAGAAITARILDHEGWKGFTRSCSPAALVRPRVTVSLRLLSTLKDDAKISEHRMPKSTMTLSRMFCTCPLDSAEAATEIE